MAENREDQTIKGLVAGRTLDEQIDCIKRYGSHSVTPALREMLLNGLGIARPKPAAENLVIFGCYIPFSTPLLVRDYLRLLDALSIDYTYLNKEYCCGSPVKNSASDTEREHAVLASKEFMQLNLDLARQKGAKNVAYCCMGCANPAKTFFPDEAAQHMYYFELLFDKIEKRHLKIAPTTLGYYEGCKVRYKRDYPAAKIDWARCRRLLDKIDGLNIVDLPNEVCCKVHPERIVEAAEKRKLDTILCSCNSCYGQIRKVVRGNVKLKFLTELLLEAVG